MSSGKSFHNRLANREHAAVAICEMEFSVQRHQHICQIVSRPGCGSSPSVDSGAEGCSPLQSAALARPEGDAEVRSVPDRHAPDTAFSDNRVEPIRCVFPVRQFHTAGQLQLDARRVCAESALVFGAIQTGLHFSDLVRKSADGARQN